MVGESKGEREPPLGERERERLEREQGEERVDSTAKEGRLLSAWLVGQGINNLVLLYNPKDLTSFHSGHWNSSTNPDLAFASADLYSRLPDRPVLEKFPKSQHRP